MNSEGQSEGNRGTERHRFLRWASIAALLVCWQVIAMLAESELLPLPGAVWGVLWSQVLSGELPGHLGITLGRVAAAFVLAMCLGTAIGMWMGRRGGINASLDALLIIGLNIPALVTIVLCYPWIGLTEVAASCGCHQQDSHRGCDRARRCARSRRTPAGCRGVYRLSPYRPAPRVCTAVISVPAGSARMAVVHLEDRLVVELLGRSDGVGFQIGTYFQFFDITSILAYTIAFAAVVYVIELLVLQPFDQRIARWRRERRPHCCSAQGV